MSSLSPSELRVLKYLNDSYHNPVDRNLHSIRLRLGLSEHEANEVLDSLARARLVRYDSGGWYNLTADGWDTYEKLQKAGDAIHINGDVGPGAVVGSGSVRADNVAGGNISGQTPFTGPAPAARIAGGESRLGVAWESADAASTMRRWWRAAASVVAGVLALTDGSVFLVILLLGAVGVDHAIKKRGSRAAVFLGIAGFLIVMRLVGAVLLDEAYNSVYLYGYDTTGYGALVSLVGICGLALLAVAIGWSTLDAFRNQAVS